MAGRGPVRKPADQVQSPGRRAARSAELVPARAKPVMVKVPKPPVGLLPATRAWWVEFFASSGAKWVDTPAVATVRRLAEYMDERDRTWAILRKKSTERFTEGSMGQVRTHPRFDQVTKLEALIVKLEQELGITPAAKARLGLALVSAQLTVEQINAMAERPGAVIDVDAVDDGGWAEGFEAVG